MAHFSFINFRIGCNQIGYKLTTYLKVLSEVGAD